VKLRLILSAMEISFAAGIDFAWARGSFRCKEKLAKSGKRHALFS
jgi:hypothetical protein